MAKIFGEIEITKCLKNLGFTYQNRSSSHIKFSIPDNHKLPLGLRPFMIVQSKRGSYSKHSCSRYISEIKQLGFTKEQIDKAFK